MITGEQVRQVLAQIVVPKTLRSLAALNLIRDVAVSDGTVKVSLAPAALNEAVRDLVKNAVTEAVRKLDGQPEVEVVYTEEKPDQVNRIKHIIAVMSGKGGVGKSLVASLVATSLRRRGASVGILDADITGPSIPRMFGVTQPPGGSDSGILPVPSSSGIQLISINLMLPKEDEAVIWRGPLIAKVITQFWEEVLWGNLDYLVIDLPPGTGDAPLTVLQKIPVDGVVIVHTPQDLTAMIVKKAFNMAHSMQKRVLGVVENMSYLYVPELDKKLNIFGASCGEEMAAACGAPLLGRIPVDPALAALCDAGEIEKYQADIVASLGAQLAAAVGDGA
jgi:Mrp family chromosome partitioning ATPase